MHRRALLGNVIALALIALPAFALTPWYAALREEAFDLVLDLTARDRSAHRVAVVDIDRAALARHGAWPWSREWLARLVGQVAGAGPRAIALDILISGADERSPAALARRLADSTGNAQIRELGGLVDGDALLAEVVGRAPTVLGIALDTEATTSDWQHTPVLVRGQPDLSDIWQSGGAIGPDAALARNAAAFGVLALPGDTDGNVRRVPLLTLADDRLVPGLSLEAARLALEAGALILEDRPTAVRIADRVVTLPPDATLRLRPTGPDIWAARTISAAQLAEDADAKARLAGRVVLIGGSAPELGGLRLAAQSRLAPSVQLQADAIEQLMAGDVPQRGRELAVFEALATIALGGVAILAGAWYAPLIGAVLVAGLAALWMLAAIAAAATTPLLVDPLIAPIGITIAFAGSAMTAAAMTWQREALLRARFEQHLSPEVVRRIVAEPNLLRLKGEMREVTALFTDLEGFTAMVERSEPQTMVRLLDAYFEGAAQIVVQHGGMVNKIIGDAVHALFNAPLDLADHARRAVDCAVALQGFSESFRAGADAEAIGFGRTRIGIETGTVVVGDVGGGRKLDYTAHGDAINTAARLEAANKDIGSSICVGPGTHTRLDPAALRPLGRVDVRGRTGALAVYEPWPASYDETARRDYLAAAAAAEAGAPDAAALFEALAQRQPGDAVLTRFVARTVKVRPLQFPRRESA